MEQQVREKITSIRRIANDRGLSYHFLLTENIQYLRIGGKVLSESGRVGTVKETTLDWTKGGRPIWRLGVEYVVDGEVVGQIDYYLKYDYVLVSKHGHVALFIQSDADGNNKERKDDGEEDRRLPKKNGILSYLRRKE